MRGGLVALLAVLASCFDPSVQPCALACAPDRSCPPGATCLEDGFCHAAGAEQLCATAADAAVDAAAADAALLDAGPGCGDGIIQTDLDEECDDGDLEPDDGCDDACAVEPGFVCTGEPSTCRPRPRKAGDVIITEIFKNPTGPGSVEPGEWFEIYNPSSTAWDLLGVRVADLTSDEFVIGDSLPIASKQSLVFAASADTGKNGGLVPDFVFSQNDFILGNNADEILVFVADSTTALDRVDYDSTNFPDNEGESMSLDPSAYDPVKNDAGANWCTGAVLYGDGSGKGTPGETNPSCQ